MADLAPVEIQGSPAPAPEAPQDGVRAIPTEPGYVALTNDAGEVQSIPIANAEKALANGYRSATRGEYVAARDGIAGKIAAGAAGLARGATFGLSDAAEVGLGRLAGGDAGAEHVRQGLAEDLDAHPGASLAGEIGGSLLPLLVGAPPVEAAAEAGESLLARAGARALQAAPRLFGEGVAYGAGHQLTEDVLGDHEAVAGKYVTAGLEGGLVNLVLGAALHAGGGAIADRLASRAATKGAEVAATEGGETFGQRVVGKLRGVAEEQAAKGAMPASSLAAGEMQKLGRTAEEQQIRVRQIGRTLLDEGVTTAGADKATQATRLTERLEETGKEIGAIRKRLAGSAIQPDAKRLFDRLQQEVVQPLAERPFSEPEIASLTPYLDEIYRTIGRDGEKGITFKDLHSFKQALDAKLDMKLWQKIPGTAPIAAEDLGKVRGILESEYEAAAERAAADVGDDIATKYKVAKAKYADLKTAERWAKKGAAREAQNQAISLTDVILAGSGIASGHGLGAAALAIGNKVRRTYGNQIVASALNHISGLEALQRGATAFDAKLAAATEAFYGKRPPPSAARVRPAITPEERVALRAAMRNPAVFAEHVGDTVARTGVAETAPNVAASISNMALRAAQLTASKFPQEPSPMGVSAFGPPKPRELGPRAQAEVDRAFDAIDTDKMLDDLGHRQLSREQVEALKIVNPPLYYAMRKSLRDYGAEHDPDMTPQQEIALSIVFDTPVSSYTRGATIRGFQQAFAQGAPSDNPASAGGMTGKPIGSGHSSAAESLASPTDRAEANGAL